MFQNFTVIIFTIVAAVNIGALITVGVDKRQSAGNSHRVPEVYFFVWAVLFGSLGVLLGMFLFRHKTKKLYFTFGILLLLAEQSALLAFILRGCSLVC